jgi:hypothetical protein
VKYSADYRFRPREVLVDNRNDMLCYVVYVPPIDKSGFMLVKYENDHTRLVGPKDQDDFDPYVKLPRRSRERKKVELAVTRR